MKTQAYQPISEEDYLALESRSLVRHEYVAGEVFAMTGASIRHNVIAGNLFTAIRLHLRGTPCRTLMEGVKLRLRKESSYFYPDVMVTCEAGLLELDAVAQIVEEPVLLIEVSSPSTEGVDRREKLRAYRNLPTLREYAMVSQDECRIELYRRRGDIGWDIITFERGDTVSFVGIELKMRIEEVYLESGVWCAEA